MKKLLVCTLTLCLLLGTVASGRAEQVKDLTLSLDFYFGRRAGLYTGTLSNGLPNGEGSFTTSNPEGVGWTYVGSWIDGHLTGYGTTYWEDSQVLEGWYSEDYLHGEGTEYYSGVLWRSGWYAHGEFIYGQICDGFGTPYFTGQFKDDFRIEDGAEKADRLRAFVWGAALFDYDAVMADPESYIGQQVVFAGEVSYLWDQDLPWYEDFALNINGDENRWANVYGYLALGDEKAVVGEKNVMVFGIVSGLNTWESDGHTYSCPLVQYMGLERPSYSLNTLSRGSSGSAVKALQTRLRELGYYAGTVDGDYGSGTQKAVEAFQAVNGLPIDGVASILTLYMVYLDEIEWAHGA